MKDSQYMEERCKQCRNRVYCVRYVGLLHRTGLYYSRAQAWVGALQKCKEGNYYKWEDKLTKHDFEEEA